MLFMIVGRFRRGIGPDGRSSLVAVQSVDSSGLTHIGSWVDASLSRSFQVIDCESLSVLQQWAARWRHRVDLEVVPILSARDGVIALEPLLE